MSNVPEQEAGFVCPEACIYKPQQIGEAFRAVARLGEEKKKLEIDKAALLVEQQALLEKQAALKRSRSLIDKGWSYVFALFLACLAPFLFVKNVQFGTTKMSVSSVELREANPVLLLVYCSFIGGVLGLPTQKIALGIGKALSGNAKDVVKLLSAMNEEEETPKVEDPKTTA